LLKFGRVNFNNKNNLEIGVELKQKALLTFKRFEQVWDFSDFWKRGNTFDACLVFAKAVDQQWPDDPEVKEMNQKIVKMLEENLVFYKSVNFGVMWADDFGWWGLMALNARQFLLSQGQVELADKYWNLSDALCWEHKKNAAYDHTKTARPVAHGCRNGDANGESPGVKNTVTNVLLFLLSSRIYRVAKAEKREDTDKYLKMAYSQWIWFTEWFNLEEYKFLKKIKTDGALVQERPMAIFDGSDYTEEEHPYWAEGWVWTGDQGMLVAALCDMIAVKEDLAQFVAKNNLDPAFDVDSFDKEANEIIRLIGNGVKNVLIADVDGIIREAPCLSSFALPHGADYLGGRGIMMRYLGDIDVKSKLGVSLDIAALNSVNAIWETRNKDNDQFQPEYTSEKNDKLYIEQFRNIWGLADDVFKWDLNKDDHSIDAVCQAIGFDMIGVALKSQ